MDELRPAFLGSALTKDTLWQPCKTYVVMDETVID